MKQEAAGFRDWGKVQFYEYPPQDWSVLLPSLSEQERDLVGSLVKYESGSRMSASKVRREARLEDMANFLSGPRACLLFVVSIGLVVGLGYSRQDAMWRSGAIPRALNILSLA